MCSTDLIALHWQMDERAISTPHTIFKFIRRFSLFTQSYKASNWQNFRCKYGIKAEREKFESMEKAKKMSEKKETHR